MPFLWISGFDIEAELFPVIETAAGPVSQGPETGRPCWWMFVHKKREGIPIYVSYFLVRHTMANDGMIPVTPYYANGGDLVATPMSRHPAGDRWSVQYCADIPPSVKNERGLSIVGTIYYRVWHNLWQVPMRVPEVPLS